MKADAALGLATPGTDGAPHLVGKPDAVLVMGLRKVGSLGETARDLAYRLYGVCERKKRSAEGLAYNSLVIAWPEITRLARAERPAETRAGLGL